MRRDREGRRSFRMGRWQGPQRVTFRLLRQSWKAAGSAACSHIWGKRLFVCSLQWLQIGGCTAGRRIQKSAFFALG